MNIVEELLVAGDRVSQLADQAAGRSVLLLRRFKGIDVDIRFVGTHFFQKAPDLPSFYHKIVSLGDGLVVVHGAIKFRTMLQILFVQPVRFIDLCFIGIKQIPVKVRCMEGDLVHRLVLLRRF